MKKTWIVLLVLAMMMMAVFATGCAEKGSPGADAQEQVTGFEDANFKVSGILGEADDAQFKINPNNIESAR